MVNGAVKSRCSDDGTLEMLAIAAQQHPPRSLERQLALNQLVNQVLTSGQLSHPQRGLWPMDLYEDLYNEALQRTLFRICHKIDAYNPIHPVMAWVNFLIKASFMDVANDYKRGGVTYIPRTERGRTFSIPSLDTLDQHLSVEEPLSDARILKQLLEEDPDNVFKKSIRDHPEATFQCLAKAIYLEDKTWAEVSDDLDISIKTLHSFFARQLQALKPYFRTHLQD